MATWRVLKLEPNPQVSWAAYCRKIFSSKAGVSDRSWNQISLDRQLHCWWGEGYFAFKPLGVDGTIIEGLDAKNGDPARYTRVKLQFHWMPRRKDIGMKAAPLDISYKEVRPQDFSDLCNKTYGDLETDDSNPVFAQDRRCSVSHLVQTGDIFYVKVKSQFAKRMLAAFQIQWAAIKILSLAGGVEALDDVGDHPKYPDESCRDWIGYVEEGTTIGQLMKAWDD